MGDRALMDEVVSEIKAVNAKLEKVEAEIVQALAEHNEEEVVALRTKEEQLRKEKEQLREEKLLLLRSALPTASEASSSFAAVMRQFPKLAIESPSNVSPAVCAARAERSLLVQQVHLARLAALRAGRAHHAARAASKWRKQC
jgi:hypothetical protein